MGTRNLKGVRCASLEDPLALMKMGLSVILIGHVNFLLGALVHGAVLRHINLHKQARAMEYSISNVMALSAGLVTWALFTFSLLAALMGAMAAVGLMLSVVRAIVRGGRSLLTLCRFPDAIGYSSITNECPFDPTRIYIHAVRMEEVTAGPTPPPCYAPPPRYAAPPIQQTQQQQHQHQQYLPRNFRSLPPSERQPLRGLPPPRQARPEEREGARPLQHQLLERATLERSSFWV
ncbi:hypothetical protein NHX12_023505 [Muraenolepis orangiensis]|uniref:Keratinocyte-associated protein 3 n=1 Tax=Muraenolepis orangiensis TaxID=630683 RepID=A0A9Q0EJK6_9TELE|nr:hypothetical protein NHX12_023505 [Muraenolepis orangiensis]